MAQSAPNLDSGPRARTQASDPRPLYGLHGDRLPGIRAGNRPARRTGRSLPGGLEEGPNDVDQTVVPLDDVPLRMGEEGRPGDRPRERNHPRGLRMGSGERLPGPLRTWAAFRPRHLEAPVEAS